MVRRSGRVGENARGRFQPAVTLLAATLLVGACGGEEAAPPATTSTSSVSTAPSDAPEDRDGTTVTPSTSSTSPTWDADSRTSATAVAARGMRLYVRRNVTADRWWSDLEPLLTPTAAQAYDGTDPTSGAPIKVTGKPSLVEGGSAHLARVHISTNQGTYMVLLSRDEAADGWLIERFTPPETLGS